MYDELLKRLRNRRICIQQSGGLEDFPLLGEAADAIEELQQIAGHYEESAHDYFKDVCYYLERMPKWIPVTERLPRDRQFVLVYCGDNKRIRPSDRFDVAILLGDSIFTSLGVTHWMPLPQPPKEE